MQTQTARLRSLVDDDVEPVILHRGIKVFFDRRLEPVDFVDEKDIASFETREQTGQLSGFFDHGTARVFHVHPHRVRDDVGERRFPQPRRAAQQDVLEDIATLFRRGHEQLETFAHFHLAGELAEHWRPQRNFEGGISLGRFHVAVRFLISSS